MPKNSVIPLILFGLILLSMPLCIHNRNSQGYNGPRLFEGIYRGQEGRFIPAISKQGMHIDNQIKALDVYVGKDTCQNFQQGLEGPGWHNVLIFAEDDHHVTRSVVKGMAEFLTGMLDNDVYGYAMPFYLVHVQPHKKNVRPWGVSTIIRIGTQNADIHPQEVGDAFNAELHFCVQDPRLPADLSALVPLTAGGVKEMAFSLKHHSKATGKDNQHMNWASWHASLGRSIAVDALQHCWNGSVEEMDWQLLDYDTEFGAWREVQPKANKDAEQTYGKKQLLPVHPDHKVVTWFGGFQEPLTRGWCGAIIGVKMQSRMGTEKATVEQWYKHIDGSGSWQAQKLMNENLRVWDKMRDEPNELSGIYTKSKSFGADVSSWMLDDRLDQRYQEWLDKAAEEDSARVLLRRYLLSKHIDKALQEQALTVLRAQATLADQAIIGLHPAATQTEKSIAQRVQFIRGASDDSSAAQAMAATTDSLQWDRKPLMIKAHGVIGVLLSQPKIKEEQVQRMQCWFRDLNGQAQRIDLQIGANNAGALGITLSEQAEGLQVALSASAR